jgi:hypothetical protein
MSSHIQGGKNGKTPPKMGIGLSIAIFMRKLHDDII